MAAAKVKTANGLLAQVEAKLEADTSQEDARRLAGEAVTLFEQAGDKQQELSALCGVMQKLYTTSQDKEELTRHADRAVALADQLGDNLSQGKAQGLLMSARLLANSREALTAGRRGLQLFREVGDKEKEASMLHEIGRAHYWLQSPVEAAAAAKEAMAMCLELGDKKQAAACLKTIAKALVQNGNAKEAVRFVETELAKAQRARDRELESLIMPTNVDALEANGAHDVAARKGKGSLRLFHDLGDRAGEAGMLRQIAELQLAMGLHPEAEHSAKSAAALSQDLGDRKSEERALFILDNVCVAKGVPDEAPHRAEALSLLREMARTLEARNAVDFKDVVKRFNNVGGTTQEDIDEIFSPVVEMDKEGAQRFIQTHNGGALFQDNGRDDKLASGGAMVIKYVEHKLFYAGFRVGGLGYGPKFRCVKAGVSFKTGGEALSVMRTSSESETWEQELLFHPGILDGALQTGATMGYMNR